MDEQNASEVRHFSFPLDGGGRGGGDFHLSLCLFAHGCWYKN